MLPTITPSNQDLLRALYQKQMQNTYTQPNVLSQLMNMNLQMNLMKLMNPETTTSSNVDNSQLQMLALLSSMGQLGGLPAQSSKLSGLSLSDLSLLNKAAQNGKNHYDLVSPDSGKQLSLPHKDSLKKNNLIINKDLKSLTMAALENAHDHTDQFASPDSNGKDSEGLSLSSKKIKKMNTCGHPERSHYAKNMCNQCYHKFGRTKKPWKCTHDKLYAHGLCQNCYINAYNKKRNLKVGDKKEEVGGSTNWNDVDTDVPTSTFSSDEPSTMEDKAAFGSFEGTPQNQLSA